MVLFPNRLPRSLLPHPPNRLPNPAHTLNYSVSDRSSGSFGCHGDAIRMGGYLFRRKSIRMRGYSGHSLDALNVGDLRLGLFTVRAMSITEGHDCAFPEHLKEDQFRSTVEPAYMAHGHKVFWHIRSTLGWSQSVLTIPPYNHSL